MKAFSAIALPSAYLLLTPTSSTAESDVSGKWIFNMAGPNGETVELKVNDKKLEGRIDRGGEQWLQLKDGKVDGAKISFTVKRDRPGGGEMVYKMVGEVTEANLTRTTTTLDGAIEVTAHRHTDRPKR